MALPFGLRRLVLTPYTDQTCTALGVAVRLPVARTLSFSETGESEELRGDDEVVASHESAPTVEWELEAGGIDFPAYCVLSGAKLKDLTTGGMRLRKKVTHTRGYFMIEGQSIADDGGDLHCLIYRAKCNDAIEGEFGDQSFFLTSASGIGYGCLMGNSNSTDEDDLFGTVYDFVQNDQVTSIPMPPSTPNMLTPGTITATSVALNWSEVIGEDAGFDIQRKLATAPDTAYVAGTPATTLTGVETVVQTGLTAATAYDFRVRAKKIASPTTGNWSAPQEVSTAP
jgi:hypothetical protein